ncbi:hypothetical protein HYW40_01815 [Candidatus Curtissbacteria bacterium]|nr:hypothetical protein [Candidatus Curtissbacteria bacterium]
MGTTKVKIIDLSSEQPEVKASQKHAQKLASVNKITKEKVTKVTNEPKDIETSEPSLSPQSPKSPQPSQPKSLKTKKPKDQKHHLGKKYKEAKAKIEKDKLYPAAEALALLTKTSYTKFDPAVEIHLNVNVKSLRGSVNFPHSVGPKKEKKYLVFADKKSEIKNVIWASADTISQIESGKLKPKRDFSSVIAAPKFMPTLAKVAKILGPAGMMPNPKSGTITENPLSVIDSSAASPSQYQTDPQAPIIHTKLGKLSEKPEFLKENLKALVLSIGPQKIKKATLKSTMSPGIKIDVSTL